MVKGFVVNAPSSSLGRSPPISEISRGLREKSAESILPAVCPVQNRFFS